MYNIYIYIVVECSDFWLIMTQYVHPHGGHKTLFGMRSWFKKCPAKKVTALDNNEIVNAKNWADWWAHEVTSEGGKGHHAKLTKSVVVSYWSCCQITHPSKGSSRGKLFPGESQQSNSEIAKSQAHAGVSCFPLDSRQTNGQKLILYTAVYCLCANRSLCLFQQSFDDSQTKLWNRCLYHLSSCLALLDPIARTCPQAESQQSG